MKISKWKHKFARYYKRGKLVSYFPNNAAETCLYGLKFSENIEIVYFFLSRALFHLSSNLHTSCFSAFKLSGRYVPENLLMRFIYQRITTLGIYMTESKSFWPNRESESIFTRQQTNCRTISSITFL